MTLEVGDTLTVTHVEMTCPHTDNHGPTWIGEHCMLCGKSRPDTSWEAFLRWESKAADEGSGMTRDQLTGALMFYRWLGEQSK